MTTSTTGLSSEMTASSPARLGRARRGAARSQSAAGFTLLELVLVMVIIGTVLGMSAASLRGFFAARRTAEAAGQIVALAQFARTQSVAEGRTYRLSLDARDGTYWLTAQTGGAFVALPSEFGRLFALPEGTTAQWEIPGSTDTLRWIGFYPDGRTEEAALRLTGRRGEAFDIICSSPVEQLRVVAATAESAP